MVHLALPCPAGLVLAHAVLEIQDRIALGERMIITGGRVDHAAAIVSLEGRIIDDGADLAVRDLMRAVVIAFWTFGNLDGAGAAVTAAIGVTVGIRDRGPVHEEVVEVETYGERFGMAVPPAVGILFHGIDGPAVDFHFGSLGRIQAEPGPSLCVDARILTLEQRGFGNSRTLGEGTLLGGGLQAETAGQQQEKCFAEGFHCSKDRLFI